MSEGIDRRSFVSSMVGMGAVLAAPEARAAPLGDAPEWPRSDALEQLFADEREVLGTRWLRQPQRVGGWDSNDLLGRSIATLLWTGHLQELPPHGHRVDRLVRHGRARLGGMSDVVFAHALRFDGMTRGDFSALDDLLASDATENRDHSEFFLGQASVRMPQRALFASRRASADMLWRLRQHGSQAVATDLVSKVDRVARSHQFDWRESAATAPDRPFDDGSGGVTPVAALVGDSGTALSADVVQEKGEAGRYADSMTPGEERLVYKYGSDPDTLREIARRKNRAGAIALSIGLLWMAGPQIIFGGICFGPPLVIAGAISLSKAARLKRLAEGLSP